MPWFKVEVEREFEIEADSPEAARAILEGIDVPTPEGVSVRNVGEVEIEVEEHDEGDDGAE